MFKILILEDAPELQDRITFLLESVSGISLEKAYDRKHAAEILRQNEGKIDLLIIDYHFGPISTLHEIQKAAAHIDTIFCVQDKGAHPATPGWHSYAVIERSFIASLLMLTVEKWRADHPGSVPSDPEKFCRIKTKLLVDVSPLNADIYARLSEIKYIKVFRESDTFDSADLEKYAQQKKIEYMYLLREASTAFIQKYIIYIEDLVRESKPISMDEVTYMHTSIHESVHELTEKLGFTREVQALAKSQVQLTVKTMGKKPVLKNLLQQLESKTGQYLADHSFLTGFIACGIAAQMEWNSEATVHKLMLASFMHDISLNDNALAACESIEEAAALHPTEDGLNQFKKHSLKTSEMVRQMSDIPADVDSIIMQHHELPNGEGFPRGLTSAYIAPLSGIFIVAHHMSKRILKMKSDFNIKTYVAEMQEQWPHSLFKKILTAAETIALE